MKKMTMIAILAAAYSTAALAEFPIGQYQGHGAWKDSAGHKGGYNVSTTSSPTSLDNLYTFGNDTRKFSMGIKPTTNGFFDVTIADQKVGEGYCMTVQCHYTLTDGSLEESIVFLNGNLYRVGSKVSNGTRIGWEESLQKVENK